MKNVQVGSVIQIDPEHDPVFGGCLMFVSEVKSWGVQCGMRIPSHTDNGTAYYRVKWDAFEVVGGLSPFMPPSHASSEPSA